MEGEAGVGLDFRVSSLRFEGEGAVVVVVVVVELGSSCVGAIGEVGAGAGGWRAGPLAPA